MCAGTRGGQKRASNPLELGSKVVVNYWTGVLGAELGPCGGAGSILNFRGSLSSPCMPPFYWLKGRSPLYIPVYLGYGLTPISV